MHVRVEVIREREHNTCLDCGGDGEMLTIFVLAGGGSAQEGPYCDGCWRVHDSEHLTISVEQPDMRPGRHPPSKAVKRRATKQERDIAQATGGIRHKASGALPGLKGDARKKGVYRADGKLSLSSQHTITRAMLDKIRSEATYGEVPAIVTTFVNKHTLQELDCWVTIPWPDFEEKIANVSAAHDR